MHPLHPIGAVQHTKIDLQRVEHLLPHERKLTCHLPVPFQSGPNGGRRRFGIVVRIRPPKGRLLDIGAPVVGQIGFQHLQRGNFVVKVAVDDPAPRPEGPPRLIPGFHVHSPLPKTTRHRERLSRPKAPCQWGRGGPGTIPGPPAVGATLVVARCSRSLGYPWIGRPQGTPLRSIGNPGVIRAPRRTGPPNLLAWDHPGGQPQMGVQMWVAGRWSTKYDGAQAAGAG